MSIEQMRDILKKVYPGPYWVNKVHLMPERQVLAVYNKFLAEGKLKGVK